MAGAPGLGLLAGMGAAQGPGGGTGGSDDLLAQIRSLLEQYLAQGSDTPVAPQAQALADAIDSSTGGGTADAAAGGAMPPEGSAAEESAETPAQEGTEDQAGQGDALDALGPLEQPDPNAYSGGSMAKAKVGAKAFLKSKNKKAKAS